MKVLSLFSGIGGIDLGLESIGWETIAFSEYDPKIAKKKRGRQYAAEVMSTRFPHAQSLGDIEQLVFAKNKNGLQGILQRESLDVLWKEDQGTRIDAIVGGFP